MGNDESIPLIEDFHQEDKENYDKHSYMTKNYGTAGRIDQVPKNGG